MVAAGFITTGFFLAATFIMTATSVTGDFADVIDTHTASKQSNGKEKTDNKNRDGHKYPGDGFKSGVTEGLEYTGTQHSDNRPVQEPVVLSYE